MDGKIIKNYIAQSDNMITQEAAGNHQPLNSKHHFTTGVVTLWEKISLDNPTCKFAVEVLKQHHY